MSSLHYIIVKISCMTTPIFAFFAININIALAEERVPFNPAYTLCSWNRTEETKAIQNMLLGGCNIAEYKKCFLGCYECARIRCSDVLCQQHCGWYKQSESCGRVWTAWGLDMLSNRNSSHVSCSSLYLYDSARTFAGWHANVGIILASIFTYVWHSHIYPRQ